ncbi:endonuclease [Paramagnetospirillum kuznetsovii]|uniref:Endonuclease n=1 Tax=Paramagnetospirillum kuznetsovii TaxID=2053833 RepID=A0A364NVI7_9PROT|nr:YqaJ viral recombinase family protein [Paramagnetospirillum kuznetsovii]RAU21098.1 endonuclease [Paramagnetospirillum kuznetsovii]
MNAVAKLIHKSPDWHSARAQGIGGSDANIIASDDPDKILRLFREKRNEIEPEDLSRVLPVQMGTCSEDLNRYWFQTETGIAVETIAKPFVHSTHKWMRCNVDGMTVAAVFEAKHVNQYKAGHGDEVIATYYPQCQHLMEVTQMPLCYLSVFFGTTTWEYYEIQRDDAYIAKLVDAEADFWDCVQTGRVPSVCAHLLAPPIAFDDLKIYDMTGHNDWADAAFTYQATKDAAKANDNAKTRLKKLLPHDGRSAAGYGVSASRSRNNAITVREI